MHKKIVIFIPKAGFNPTYEALFVESLFTAKDYLMAKANEIPFEFTISQYFSHTFPIDANRNECVSMAIKNNIDLSIYLDTDHIIPHDALFKLIKHDKPIVAGVYFLKGEPHAPVIYTENKKMSDDFDVFNSIYFIGDKSLYEYEGLFEADMTGAGCFAISLDVLKMLEKPYWKYREVPKGILPPDGKTEYSGNNSGDEELTKIYENWMSDTKFKIENGIESSTEDVWFWRNVRKNTPYKLLIDPTIIMPHGPMKTWIDGPYSEVYFNVKTKKASAEDMDKCRVQPMKDNSVTR